MTFRAKVSIRESVNILDKCVVGLHNLCSADKVCDAKYSNWQKGTTKQEFVIAQMDHNIYSSISIQDAHICNPFVESQLANVQPKQNLVLLVWPEPC